MTNAMEQAFARVGINGYAGRQVGRQIPLQTSRPKTPPDPSIPPENRGISTTRDRILEVVAAIGAMSDGELEIEFIALSENAEAIRVELRGVAAEPGLHEVGWQRRAERALAGIKSRLAICAREREQRQAARTELKQAANAERQAEHERLLAEHRAKAETKREFKLAKDAADALAFVRHARALLARDTVLAIWEAVNAEAGAAA